MPITCDMSTWPLPVMTMGRDGRTAADLEEHIANQRACLVRGPCVFIIDIRESHPLNASERRRLGAFIREHLREYPGHLLGTVVVASSAMHRSIISAVMWLSRPPQPVLAAATIDEAFAKGRALSERAASSAASSAP